MKQCRRCGQEKPAEDFSKGKRSADGLSYWCRACCSAESKAWRTRLGDSARTKWREMRKENPELFVWRDMNRRCSSSSRSDFAHYGGRGIKVCDRWRESFENFLADMGHRPSPKHSIDSIDNDGNYEPGNCRWATQKEQTRNFCRNRLITARGKTQCQAAWAEELGVSSVLINQRLDKLGWTEEEAVTVPKKTSIRKWRAEHGASSEAA